MISYNICRGHTPRIVFGITMLIVMLLAEGTGAAIDDASAHLSAEFAQSAVQINFGETISANISSASEMDTYTFSANSGDKILIRMDSSWANGPELRLYAPNGTQINYASGNGWCCNYIYSSEITQTLPANGVYTILAGDYEGHDTGSYGIYIQRTNNPGNANPIGFGETKSAYINSTAEMDTYTFSACSGKSILIRMQSSWANGPELRLYAPNGTRINYTSGNGWCCNYIYFSEITQTLPDNGVYTILAGDYEGHNTGSYGISLLSTSTLSCITVTTPNGGENWARGTAKTISWTSSGSPGTNVRIELLKSGMLNRTINSSTPNDGSYNWAIPFSQIPGSDYKIRVTSTTNSAFYDTSDNNFTISDPAPKTGDINGDGQLKLVDAIYLAKHVGGFNGYEVIYADGDINCDGKVTLVDALYMAKHIGGFIGYEKLYCAIIDPI